MSTTFPALAEAEGKLKQRQDEEKLKTHFQNVGHTL